MEFVKSKKRMYVYRYNIKCIIMLISYAVVLVSGSQRAVSRQREAMIGTSRVNNSTGAINAELRILCCCDDAG